MKLRNRTIWITGASSGIGEALAHQLAEAGNRLIISGRNRDALERVKSELAKSEQEVELVELDLENSQSISEAVARVKSKFDSIDVLINNAGISQRSIVKDTSMDVLRRLMEVNYFGTIDLTKQCIPLLERSNIRPKIAVISSLVGKFGTQKRSGYSASKHAIHGFFEALRAEIGTQMDIQIICPGYIKTRLSFNALTGDGSPQDKMDRAQDEGMSPEVFARKMIRALEKNKAEVYIGGKEVIGVYIHRFFPGLFRRTIYKVRVT